MSTGFATERGQSSGSTGSIVELDNGQKWSIEADTVRAVLAEVFGADVLGEQLPPPEDHAGLRARFRAEAPQLTALTDEVRRAFSGGACGILVTRLGLSGLSVDDQRKAIYALSVLLGDVVWTHPVDNRVVWDVKAQAPAADPAESAEPAPRATRYSSFSENDQEAEYHTDASFAVLPDRYFLLYSVQQADCGGGETFLTDARTLTSELEATPEGREATRLLTEAVLPMRVPKAFRQRAAVGGDGYSYTPMIEDGVWRFRKDKIEKGLAAHPEYATDEVRRAVDLVYQQLDARPDEFRAVIPTDGILIVDNHKALHGRTSFTDSRRHLLRARFHKAPAE
ncbi:MAG TPA: TauD/TfdA family dioxygenase [Pseudonocardia sp.]|jgi:hypothetical protein